MVSVGGTVRYGWTEIQRSVQLQLAYLLPMVQLVLPMPLMYTHITSVKEDCMGVWCCSSEVLCASCHAQCITTSSGFSNRICHCQFIVWPEAQYLGMHGHEEFSVNKVYFHFWSVIQ